MGIHKYIRKSKRKKTINLKKIDQQEASVFSLQSVSRVKIPQRTQGTHQTERKSRRARDRGALYRRAGWGQQRAKSLDKVKRKREGERQGRRRRVFINLQNNTLQIKINFTCIYYEIIYTFIYLYIIYTFI